MRRPQIVEQIRKALSRVAPDAQAILYGSEARGDARPDSDIDLLVLVDSNHAEEAMGTSSVPHTLPDKCHERRNCIMKEQLSQENRFVPGMNRVWRNPFSCGYNKKTTRRFEHC